MNSTLRAGWVVSIALLGAGTAACGPTIVNFDPNNAKTITVRPANGRNQFCPGMPFKVELLAHLHNGSSCSSVDRALGCQGEKDAVLNQKMVRIEGTHGRFLGDREDFMWEPPGDLFVTADTGIRLKGWLQADVGGKLQESVAGEALLVPVYSCHTEAELGGGTASVGAHGGPGPDIDVSITELVTPFYPDAALVRVDAPSGKLYFISASPSDRIRVASFGVWGGNGHAGVRGRDGDAGRAGSGQCAHGENGRDGTDGGNGADGGDGGPGGLIRLHLDQTGADALRERLILESPGGGAGQGGPGGDGGRGGAGGSAGPTGPGCSGKPGQAGRDGRRGENGRNGRPGPNGPPPIVAKAPRAALFASEMAVIQRIESAKAPGDAER